MTLLVTGATGHVGGEIVRQAAKRGMPVIATYRGEFREDEAPGSSVKWVRCDLADADAVRKMAQENRIDACIHAAAVSNEAYAKPDPLVPSGRTSARPRICSTLPGSPHGGALCWSARGRCFNACATRRSRSWRTRHPQPPMSTARPSSPPRC